MEVVGFVPHVPENLISLVDMNLMNCRGGRRRRLDLDYAKSFASSKMPTSQFRPARRKSPRIRRVSGFDLYCPWGIRMEYRNAASISSSRHCGQVSEMLTKQLQIRIRPRLPRTGITSG